jgi:signal transduction histidine kinase
VKYNRPGGKVDITVIQMDGDVVASIVDTGIGMSETEGALIFEPFYRGDKAQATGKGGVGLGLAIVKRIVEEHGGTIRVQSELDSGTSISLTIPCAPENSWNQRSTGSESWKQKEAS